MRDLARSLRLTGRPVPVPWPGLAHYIKPRGQNLMLVLAAGGVGKSQFALNWATQAGVPALYISLDTALVDHGVRLLAARTNRTVDEIQKGVDDDPDAWARRWGAELEKLDIPTRFAEGVSSVKEIEELVAAEAEYWGTPPYITVVDNLMDVVAEEGASQYRQVLGGLKGVAKKHDTLVMALHHLRKPASKKKAESEDEEEDPGAQPVSLDEALYAVDQHAQFALGLWKPQWNRMSVGVLKNRMGIASRGGWVRASLSIDLSRGVVTDPIDPRLRVSDLEEN